MQFALETQLFPLLTTLFQIRVRQRLRGLDGREHGAAVDSEWRAHIATGTDVFHNWQGGGA